MELLKQIQQLVEQTKLDTAEYLRQNHQELQQKMDQRKLDLELGKMELREFLEERRNERSEQQSREKKRTAGKTVAGTERNLGTSGSSYSRSIRQKPFLPSPSAQGISKYAVYPI